MTAFVSCYLNIDPISANPILSSSILGNQLLDHWIFSWSRCLIVELLSANVQTQLLHKFENRAGSERKLSGYGIRHTWFVPLSVFSAKFMYSTISNAVALDCKVYEELVSLVSLSNNVVQRCSLSSYTNSLLFQTSFWVTAVWIKDLVDKVVASDTYFMWGFSAEMHKYGCACLRDD